MTKAKKSLRDFRRAADRRLFLESELKIKLRAVASFNFAENTVAGANIENLVGATQTPLAVAGPLSIRYPAKIQEMYIPLATTEGALVASISRGAKAVTEAGGAIVAYNSVGITRGPVFRTKNITHSSGAVSLIQKNFAKLQKVARTTSAHLTLTKIDTAYVGKNLYCRFYFDTADAMGMNMATFATEEIAKSIEKLTGAVLVSLAGNFDIDKKPAWLNFINGRGKQVWAEITISPKIVREVLKTTPQKIVQIVHTKQHLGSILSGSLGFNAHFANVIAAIFLATGQDIAHVVEGSLGITEAEVEPNGNLYFSVYLPSLIIGTVGGGTGLPTQKGALDIMGIKAQGGAEKFAQIIAAAVLAGELSLTASLAEGSLAAAHKKLARKPR